MKFAAIQIILVCNMLSTEPNAGSPVSKIDASRSELDGTYSVMAALSGPLQSYAFFSHKEKGTLGMHVSEICFHFANDTWLQVSGTFQLAFPYDTPAYMPSVGPLPVAQIAVGFELNGQRFKVDDDAQFMAGLYTLVRITCTTPIVGVRLNLWSCPVGTLATRGFDVETCLEHNFPFCARLPDTFVQHKNGNVMKFELLLPSLLSLKFHDGEWELSLYQDLGGNE